MGLYKRSDSDVWWMSVIVNGKRHRASTETSNKKTAQRIYNRAADLAAEGKWLGIQVEGEEHTIEE